ncbi:MAG: epimerase [Pseudomonadota bacterium]
MKQTALILGARGRFGRHAAAAFEAAGWTVRRFNRDTDDLWDAAWGAQVIVNGWNPVPWRWEAELAKLTEELAEVAAASGATVFVPGNVYSYGADLPPVLTEQTPHAATHVYGRLRREMEETLRGAGVRTVILRAGDFLDDAPSGNWFDKIMVAGLPKGVLTMPGPVDVPHAYAFLPDMARAVVDLAERRDTLALFEDIPFDGLTLTGQEIADHLAALMDRPVRIKRFGWTPLRVLRPAWPMARYLVAMRYLWERPHQLDGARLDTLLPNRQRTDARTALAAAIGHHIDVDEGVPGEATVA